MGLIFAQRLKELRKEKGMTQTELGEKLGYGYTAIANYESGRNEPSLSDLHFICRILDTSSDYLIGLSDIRKPYMILEQRELDFLNKQTKILAKACQVFLRKSYNDEQVFEIKKPPNLRS